MGSSDSHNYLSVASLHRRSTNVYLYKRHRWTTFTDKYNPVFQISEMRSFGAWIQTCSLLELMIAIFELMICLILGEALFFSAKNIFRSNILRQCQGKALVSSWSLALQATHWLLCGTACCARWTVSLIQQKIFLCSYTENIIRVFFPPGSENAVYEILVLFFFRHDLTEVACCVVFVLPLSSSSSSVWKLSHYCLYPPSSHPVNTTG